LASFAECITGLNVCSSVSQEKMQARMRKCKH